MINEGLLKKLRNFEYLSLVFSIQSIDNFNRLRTGVDPSIIMKNIKLAQKYGLSVRMNTVLTNQTYSQIEKIVDFAIQNKIDRYSIGLYAENGQRLESNLEMKSYGILPQTPWKLKMTAPKGPNNSDKMTLGKQNIR